MAPAQAAGACVALASVLALILALSWIRQRLPSAAAQKDSARKLRLCATLPVDARRKLHLIEVEGSQALLLTGGGSDVLLAWNRTHDAGIGG